MTTENRRRGIVANVLRLIGRRTLVALVVTVLASFVIAGVELGVATFLQLFLKSIGVLGADVHTPFSDARPSAATLAIALGTIAIVRSLGLFLSQQSGYVAMEMINARLRRLAVWDMLLHPSRRVVPAAAINARVGDLAVKSSLFCYYAANLLGVGVQALALIPLMLFMAPGETLVALVGLGAVGVFVLWVNRRVRGITSNVPAELRVLTEGIQRVARNSLLVRILRTETIEHRRLTTSVDRYAGFMIRAGFLGSFAGSLPPFVGVLLILLIVGLSQAVFHSPGMTLVAFLYLLIRFVSGVANSATLSSSASTNWPSFKDSLDYASEFDDDQLDAAMLPEGELVGRATERPKSSGGEPPAISVRDVHFRYPGGATEVLHGASVEIEKGSQLAIIGPSGCGKSTLLSLVLGLLEPSSGDIVVGGVVPTKYFSDPQVRVGYVGAEPFLIAGSIRENLRYGVSVEATDADLIAALESAAMRTVVERLPDGLDYVIGEDGGGLSAGQKQRLCLARAPQPAARARARRRSANLDNQTEVEIADSLRGSVDVVPSSWCRTEKASSSTRTASSS